MGITLQSKSLAIDLGYFGFNRLRTKVAELTCEEIGDHYKYLEKGMFIFNGKEKEVFFEKYNKKISELEEKHKIPGGILDFLYASDCEGDIPSEACKQIYGVIKDCDEDIQYGYTGRSDCATFKDFKEIVKDCIDNNCHMEWH